MLTFMPFMLRPSNMSGNSSPPPPSPPGGSMGIMLVVMIGMTLLILNPNIRTSLGDMADPILAPILPEQSYFVITVLILGTFSMTINTVLRNFFMDPMAQAHIGHRQGQVRKMMNDARISRDPILQEKSTILQQQMMPEQMKIQMGAMKPMMFTMIFIIGIFAWLTSSVEQFRVDYVSLPWAPEWNLLDDKFLFFPAWICTYICMSAPFGRVVDRHIKLFRYRNHPLITAGEMIKEPLLHLVATKPTEKSDQARKRQQRSQRKGGPRKQSNVESTSEKKLQDNSAEPWGQKTECPDCGSNAFTKDGPRTKRCNICLTEWV
jgi:uncharacterized membrane protein (DUF106 family)